MKEKAGSKKKTLEVKKKKVGSKEKSWKWKIKVGSRKKLAED